MKKNKTTKNTVFHDKLKSAGVTIYAVSKATGVRWQTIYNWCKGNTRPTVNERFLAMCRWLQAEHNITVTLNDF